MDQKTLDELNPEEITAVWGEMTSLLAGARIEPVVFTPAETQIPAVRTEYRLDGPRLQVHFFPAEEGAKFPPGFGGILTEVTTSFDKVVVDYVGEVNSWYLEVPTLAVPSPFVAEEIFRRVSGRLTHA